MCVTAFILLVSVPCSWHDFHKKHILTVSTHYERSRAQVAPLKCVAVWLGIFLVMHSMCDPIAQLYGDLLVSRENRNRCETVWARWCKQFQLKCMRECAWTAFLHCFLFFISICIWMWAMLMYGSIINRMETYRSGIADTEKSEIKTTTNTTIPNAYERTVFVCEKRVEENEINSSAKWWAEKRIEKYITRYHSCLNLMKRRIFVVRLVGDRSL